MSNAFPQLHFPNGTANPPAEEGKGMSLRDYFAAKALVGLISEPASGTTNVTVVSVTGRYAGAEPVGVAEQFAEAAYLLADAMLKVRQA